jgi:hypothetical protein
MKKKPAKKKVVAKKTTTKKSAAKKQAPMKKAPLKKAPMKKAPLKKAPPVDGGDTATQIDQRFRDIGGWRGETLARMRKLILEADPELVEERKWIKPSNPFGVPTYSHGGLVLTLEVYKGSTKRS